MFFSFDYALKCESGTFSLTNWQNIFLELDGVVGPSYRIVATKVATIDIFGVTLVMWLIVNIVRNWQNLVLFSIWYICGACHMAYILTFYIFLPSLNNNTIFIFSSYFIKNTLASFF